MQVSSFCATASMGVLQGSSLRDPAGLMAADLALQDREERSLTPQRSEDGQGQGHHRRDRSADKGARAHHRMNRLGRALNRVLAGQEAVSASANILVSGPAASQTGVAVSLRAERVYGL